MNCLLDLKDFCLNQGAEEAEKGLSAVNNAGDFFKQIQQFVYNVSIQIQEVSELIEQMTKGTQQVVDAVREIDEIAIGITHQSQDDSATTEERLASMGEIAQKWVKSIFVNNCDDEELVNRNGYFT